MRVLPMCEAPKFKAGDKVVIIWPKGNPWIDGSPALGVVFLVGQYSYAVIITDCLSNKSIVGYNIMVTKDQVTLNS